jgi:hypothetical protein
MFDVHEDWAAFMFACCAPEAAYAELVDMQTQKGFCTPFWSAVCMGFMIPSLVFDLQYVPGALGAGSVLAVALACGAAS